MFFGCYDTMGDVGLSREPLRRGTGDRNSSRRRASVCRAIIALQRLAPRRRMSSVGGSAGTRWHSHLPGLRDALRLPRPPRGELLLDGVQRGDREPAGPLLEAEPLVGA